MTWKLCSILQYGTFKFQSDNSIIRTVKFNFFSPFHQVFVLSWYNIIYIKDSLSLEILGTFNSIKSIFKESIVIYHLLTFILIYLIVMRSFCITTFCDRTSQLRFIQIITLFWQIIIIYFTDWVVFFHFYFTTGWCRRCDITRRLHALLIGFWW